MAKRVRDITPEQSLSVLRAWVNSLPRQPDGYRSLDALNHILYDDQAVWFHGPTDNSYIYLTGVQPGIGAQIHAISLDGRRVLADMKGLRTLIKEIMAELELPRIQCFVPAPLVNIHKMCKDIGFSQEGRLRKSAYFNGDRTDMIVFGLLFEDIEIDPKPKQRRRRRRKRARK